MRAKFLPVHDGIIRAVYPLLGSRGVIDILPQFKTKQVNMRAYSLGVKIDDGGRRKALDRRHNIRDIYPNVVEHLAYARRWA